MFNFVDIVRLIIDIAFSFRCSYFLCRFKIPLAARSRCYFVLHNSQSAIHFSRVNQLTYYSVLRIITISITLV